jgi:hypothetical protein
MSWVGHERWRDDGRLQQEFVMTDTGGVPTGGVPGDPVGPKSGDWVLVKPMGSTRFTDYGVLQVRTATVVVVLSGKFHTGHPQVNTYELSRYRIELARHRGRAVG